MQHSKGGSEISLLILVVIGAMLFSGLFYTLDDNSLSATKKIVIPVTPSAQITPEKTLQLRSDTFITVTPTTPPTPLPTIVVPIITATPGPTATPTPTSPYCVSYTPLPTSACICPSSREALSCTGSICGGTLTVPIPSCNFSSGNPAFTTNISNPACRLICL